MYKHFLKTILISFFLVISFSLVEARECGSVPTSNCEITLPTVFVPGNYSVQNISITADNTLLDCRGAILDAGNTGIQDAPIIFVGGVSGNTIQNCNFHNYPSRAIGNTRGSTSQAVGYFTIQDNTFISNTGSNAIQLSAQLSPNVGRSSLTNHVIIGNTIRGFHDKGIAVLDADASYIARNDIDIQNPNSQKAIELTGGSNSIVESNTLNNGGMIITDETDITTINNTLRGNTISNAVKALELNGPSFNRITNNTLMNNNQAIILTGGSNNNNVTRNNINNSGGLDGSTIVGVNIDDGSNNKIFLNNFVNLDNPASEGPLATNNDWTEDIVLPEFSFLQEEYGNFYTQYSTSSQMNTIGQPCTNIARTNFCDNPHIFSGGQDDAPLRTTGMVPGIPPPTIQPMAPIVASESEQVKVTIDADSPTGILTYTVSDPKFIQTTGTPNEFTWMTNFQSAGNYKVNVTATDSFGSSTRMEVDYVVIDANDDCAAYPTKIANGCVVKSDITYPKTMPDQYVPDGISFGNDNVKLNCNGATFYGDNENGKHGVIFTSVSNSELRDCTIKNYQIGVSMVSSHNNVIAKVKAIENAEGSMGSHGIALTNSNNNIVRYSTFSDNGDIGIRLYNSNFNTILSNTVANNGNSGGINLLVSSDNTIVNNNVIGNSGGGIELVIFSGSGDSNNNIIRGNTIQDTTSNRGIWLRKGNNNLVYHNNLLNNPTQIMESNGNTGNQWSFNGEGNFYDNHACSGNGEICSNSYIQNGAIDQFPYRNQNGWVKVRDREDKPLSGKGWTLTKGGSPEMHHP